MLETVALQRTGGQGRPTSPAARYHAAKTRTAWNIASRYLRLPSAYEPYDSYAQGDHLAGWVQTLDILKDITGEQGSILTTAHDQLPKE
jgi:hypothetical protein